MTSENLIWAEIPGYAGYEASSAGHIRNAMSGHVLTPQVKEDGYLRVRICGKHIGIHRAVCMAFHGTPKRVRRFAAHKNGNRTDNSSANLRWSSRLENNRDIIEHGTHVGYGRGEMNIRAKIDGCMVRKIKISLNNGERVKGISEKLKLPFTTIDNIRRGRTWSHISI